MRATWSATSRRVSVGAPATAIAMMLSGLRMSCATVAASEPSSARRACNWRSRSRAAICCVCSTRAAASARTDPNSSATWRGPGGAASQPASSVVQASGPRVVARRGTAVSTGDCAPIVTSTRVPMRRLNTAEACCARTSAVSADCSATRQACRSPALTVPPG